MRSVADVFECVAGVGNQQNREMSCYCGCSSMVEQQPSKLNTRVRFPSPALLEDRLGLKDGTGLTNQCETELS